MSKPQFGEPWTNQFEGKRIIYGLTENGTDRGYAERYARRAIACVNACAGLSDEELKRVRAVNKMYELLKESQGFTGGNWRGRRDAAVALADGKDGGE